jgi:hypothetical protein
MSSGKLRRVALVRTDVSEELSASFIRVQKNQWTRNKTSCGYQVLTRATWRNIPEDAIFHSHRRENFKSNKLRTVLHSAYFSFPLRPTIYECRSLTSSMHLHGVVLVTHNFTFYRHHVFESLRVLKICRFVCTSQETHYVSATETNRLIRYVGLSVPNRKHITWPVQSPTG